MFLAYLYLFLFLGGKFIFDWLELVELFRLYLGASLCTLPFQLLPNCFYLVWLFMLGGVYFMFLVSNCLLIYDYEFFIVICLYCVLFEIKILFFFTCIFFTHAVMHFVEVFQEIYRLIQLSCCLLLQLMDSSQD